MKQKQPNSNFLFRKIDSFQIHFKKIQKIDPIILHTSNREDIKLRISFLLDVLEKGVPYEKTLYYQFIADVDKGIHRDPNKSSSEFIKLYHGIKQSGILVPIIVGKFSSKVIKMRYILKNKETWHDYHNENGLQLIDGAHRLAIALYLRYESIPVKIIKSVSFKIPDYTGYLELKRKEYLEKINKNLNG